MVGACIPELIARHASLTAQSERAKVECNTSTALIRELEVRAANPYGELGGAEPPG